MQIFNPDHEKSHELRSRKKIKEILDSINDQEMRNHLEKWIYQFTSVCNDQLNNEPVAVAPFKLNLKPNSNWEESTANKAPPRSQMLAKQKEVRFIILATKLGLIRKSTARSWSQVY